METTVIEWRSGTLFFVDDIPVQLATIPQQGFLVKNETPFDSLFTQDDWNQWGEYAANPYINSAAYHQMFKAQRIAQAKARAGVA